MTFNTTSTPSSMNPYFFALIENQLSVIFPCNFADVLPEVITNNTKLYMALFQQLISADWMQ